MAKNTDRTKTSFSLYETAPPCLSPKQVKLDSTKRISVCGPPGPARKLEVKRSGKIELRRLNEIIAEMPYEDRLLDSVLTNIKPPDFCPVIEVDASLSDLVNIGDVEEMLGNAGIISDGEYGGYCTEDVDLRKIPRII